MRAHTRKGKIEMLATLNDLMKIAEEKEIAIGSFNTPNLEALQAVIAVTVGTAESGGAAVFIIAAAAAAGRIAVKDAAVGRRGRGEGRPLGRIAFAHGVHSFGMLCRKSRWFIVCGLVVASY